MSVLPTHCKTCNYQFERYESTSCLDCYMPVGRSGICVFTNWQPKEGGVLTPVGHASKLYDLPLHSMAVFSGYTILRVAGGWIYETKNGCQVFVPFDNEFMPINTAYKDLVLNQVFHPDEERPDKSMDEVIKEKDDTIQRLEKDYFELNSLFDGLAQRYNDLLKRL